MIGPPSFDKLSGLFYENTYIQLSEMGLRL